MSTARYAIRSVALAALAAGFGGAQAFTFEAGDLRGNFDSTISVGLGMRTKSPDCTAVTAGATGPGAPAGCLTPNAGLGDQGDLNYAKGHLFTAYIKGSHELLVKAPNDITFLGRVNWIRDFAATRTTGILSFNTPPALTNGLADDAASDLKFKARLLDLWVSKSFQVGNQQARVRVGNQVVSWGESLFLPGGINSTNAMDIMRLSQPGTQLKEVYLPAPMVSFASGLGHGLNVEAYLQTAWNASYFPPTGSYWSVVNGLGKGLAAYGMGQEHARNGGQWGVALRWQPATTQINLGAYAMNYHDKTPNLSLNLDNSGAPGWAYLQDRRLYGVSANFPAGDWALGTELSYRPRDAVSINPNASGCASQNGNCWVDEARWQWHGTALLSLTPSTGGGILRALGADTATLLFEAVAISYPHLKQTYGGDPVDAGLWGWGQLTPAQLAANPTPLPLGSKTSWGYNFDFSWVYDGSVIPGWQVQPEVYYFQAVSGNTPNIAGLFLQGAKSANFILTFTQNPANWVVALNYAKFWNGAQLLAQPLKDRDFIGLVVSRNF